jgi:hypothetical protein
MMAPDPAKVLMKGVIPHALRREVPLRGCGTVFR